MNDALDMIAGFQRVDMHPDNHVAKVTYRAHGKVHEHAPVGILVIVNDHGCKYNGNGTRCQHAGNDFTAIEVRGYSQVHVSGCDNQRDLQFFKCFNPDKFG